MNARTDHLLDEALDLTADERSALVAALVDSLDGSDEAEVSKAWQQELIRRQEALRSGAVQPVPWSDVKARIRAL